MAPIKSLKGSGVALITPFKKDGSIDFDGLTAIVNHMIKGKMDYIVILGTTGEAATLNAEERNEVIKHIIDTNKKKLPLVLGIGSNNTADVVHHLQTDNLKGINAVLSVTPYYNKPNQQGLYTHYKTIAAASPLPLILYNVPGRTGVNMTAETQLHLAHECENIIATKEASGKMEQVMEIIKSKPKNFTVISGDDNLTLPMIACGAEGVISVSANAFPRQMSDLVRSAMLHQWEKAKKIHYSIFTITNMFFEEGSPAGVKECLAHLSITKNYVRLPLTNVSENLSQKILNEIAGL